MAWEECLGEEGVGGFVGGDVVGNIIGVIAQLGNAGITGLIALVIVVWLFRHQNRFDDAV